MYSQTKEVKGYIITANNQKLEGSFKTDNWLNTPDLIAFQTEKDEKYRTYSPVDIKGFGLLDGNRYLSAEVEIQTSADNARELNYSKVPQFETKTLFLKQLLNGSLSIFEYSSSKRVQFFIQNQEGVFTTLVYKRYYVEQNVVAVNDYYKQQLFNIFSSCEEIKGKLANVGYKRKELVRLVSSFNKCLDSDYEDLTANNTKENPVDFHLTPMIGFQSSSLTFQERTRDDLNPEFDGISALRFGVEGEIVVKTIHLGVFLGLAFDSAIEENISISTPPEVTTIDSQTVDLQLQTSQFYFGIRYYIPVSELVKIHFHAGLAQDRLQEFVLDYEFSEDLDDDRASSSTFFGGGVQIGRFTVEARFSPNKDLFVENAFDYETDYSTLNVMLGYKFF